MLTKCTCIVLWRYTLFFWFTEPGLHLSRIFADFYKTCIVWESPTAPLNVLIFRWKGNFGSVGAPCQWTPQTSSIQNLALQVGQGTLLDNQVSGLCWSWRLANHRPRQERHHMGLQKHCWQPDSLSAPSVWQSLTNLVFAGTCIQPIQGSISCPMGSVYGWLRSTCALNVSRKSSLIVWWITTLAEFLMGAWSFSLSSAYSVELSLIS